MTLIETISNDWKTALKAGSADKTVLSAMLSDIKNKAVATGSDRNAVPDSIAVSAMTSMVKQRLETIEIYRTAGKLEQATSEEKEVAVIRRYLPADMSEQEVLALINDICSELSITDPKDMGKVMKVLSPKIKGRFDGKQAMALVSAKLANS